MLPRREFLSDLGLGFTGLALGSMLHRDGIARASSGKAPTGKPHLVPKAKSVIWLFMVGGVTQMESFDPKPALAKYGGMSMDDTPWKDAATSPWITQNLRIVDKGKKIWKILYPPQVGYVRAKTGMMMADNWPHLAHCVDDIAFVRSMWSTDDNHGAQLQFHTGRHILDGQFPSFGSWVNYGLGSLNDNLPQFVVLGESLSDRFGGNGGHRGDYLGPEYDGVQIKVDPKEPVAYSRPDAKVTAAEQRSQFELIGDLNRLAAVQYPDDPLLRARIKSYELAYGMQRELPEVMNFTKETEATRRMYGLDNPATRKIGEFCLSARRLVERGVRFVQVYDGPANGGGKWDTHSDSRKQIAENAFSADRPVAALLTDLKRRGMLEETLVCFVTEFGRSPGGQGTKASGREHNPYAFTVWMAGGGIKGGVVHGATDELGFHAVENRHYVTDIHATVLHQLGLDPRQLVVPGRKRLEIDYGNPIAEIIA